MKSLYKFLESIISNTSKGLVLIIHYFTYTPYYLLYIFMSIPAFFCSLKPSYIHIICETFICVLLIFTFFLFVLLNLNITKKRFEYFLGKSFIDRFLPGHFKGLFSFLLFVFTLAMLDYIEVSSIYMRVCEYRDSLDLINQNIDNIGLSKSDIGIENNINDILLKIRDIHPRGYPKTGILTDISSRVCII